jgi:predicted CopG family antitoxin
MAKNIPVTDDVYKQLNEIREKYESFSSLIRKLLRIRSKLSNLAGTSTESIEEWLEIQRLKEEGAKNGS